MNEFKKTGTLKYNHWREGSKSGPKPLLKRKSVNQLVDEYIKDTDGGSTVSQLKVESDVVKRIKNDWSDDNPFKEKKSLISPQTVTRYAKNMMAIRDLNNFEYVSNKTSSRAVSEMSVRSTIAYLLVVATTHFVNAPPSKHHTAHKHITKHPLYMLLNKLNKEVLGSKYTDEEIESLTYILPNLITSTDECSLFITNKIINSKIKWYFSARPNHSIKPNIDSGRRDIYTTNQIGDAHLRGIRISLNNTFSAGGRSAPIFACVFGLKPMEMPGNEIVVVKIRGLISGSDTNMSLKEGFIVFIRGQYETKDVREEHDSNSGDDTNDDTIDSHLDQSISKESRVAKIYREQVYYPFLKEIRIFDYDMDPDTKEIPSNLTAVSWMDGCHGQLKLTTTEKVLKVEKNLKIITCKHSPARTAVEQASDVGPMFLLMKGTMRKMPCETVSNTPLYTRINNKLSTLEDQSDPENQDIVILPTHKKNAILEGLSKLPAAMATSYTSSNIKSAFRDNGQIDETNGCVPSLKNILGTYRGSITTNHILEDGIPLIKKFYKEMYTEGKISESTFDEHGIDPDRDANGELVSRDFTISCENCQRAKILSSDVQCQERLELMKEVQKKEKEKLTTLIDEETKKYSLNEECEKRIVDTYEAVVSSQANLTNKTNNEQQENRQRPSFNDIKSSLSKEHLGDHNLKGISKLQPNVDHLKAFIQVRHKITAYRGKHPVYKSVSGIKRDKLITMCLNIKTHSVQSKQFRHDIVTDNHLKDEQIEMNTTGDLLNPISI